MRRAGLVFGLMLGGGLASAAGAAAQATPPPRPGASLQRPLELPPHSPLARRAAPETTIQAAPVPNRQIEAPDPNAGRDPLMPSLEPTLIGPGTRPRGFTFGREHAPDSEEKLFRDLVPGARLRIPIQ
jgi:hypothetical protein